MAETLQISEAMQIPDKTDNLIWWTYGDSNPGLVHAMDACYHYTIGP